MSKPKSIFELYDNIVLPIADYAISKYKDKNPELMKGFKTNIDGCEVYLRKTFCGTDTLITDNFKKYYNFGSVLNRYNRLFWVYSVFILLPKEDRFYKIMYHSEDGKNPELVKDFETSYYKGHLNKFEKWLCNME